jgi:Peptidase MA superfamily
VNTRTALSRQQFVIGLLAVCLLALVPLVHAPQPVDAAARMTVNDDEATSNFPDGIELKLDVDGKRPIERVELLYRAADLETYNLEVPQFKPAKHVTIDHHLDFRVNYLPSGIDVTYHWRLTDDKGQAFETDPRTVLWADNRFDWQTLTANDVTVYAYNQNPAFDQMILDRAQQAADQLKGEYGVKAVAPIRIWVYNSKEDFSATLRGNSEPWIGGSAYMDYHLIVAILPEGNKSEIGRIVPHEMSHQVLYQATKNPFNAPPLWLDEGLAVLHQDNGAESFPAIVKDAAEKGHLFSVRALVSSFPYDPADAGLAYAESLSIVRFVIDRFGEDRLRAVIAAYRTGVSHDDALWQGLGIDMDGLDRLWKESLDYPGDRPRSAATTKDRSAWTDFFGSGLASGALVFLCVLLAVGLYGLTSARRAHRTLSRPS